jgi:hypothetical protein
MRRSHRGDKYPPLFGPEHESDKDLIHVQVCVHSHSCSISPDIIFRGGQLLSAVVKIKGYMNALRPFISSPSAANCPLPLSDEVERNNKPLRSKPECTHKTSTPPLENQPNNLKQINIIATV